MTIGSEARRLMIAWKAAYARKVEEGSVAADHAEQEAYDELIDWVEENDLNGTVHDPRGPIATEEA